MYRIVALGDLKRLTEKNTVMLTQTLANVVWPQINGLVKATTATQFERQNYRQHVRQSLMVFKTVLDEPIGDLLQGTNVLRVKIFNGNGLTVYSTDDSQLGEQMEAGYAGNKSIESNEVISVAEFEGAIKNIQGKVLKDRFVVSSYLPVRMFNNSGPDGVFEIYNDATEIYQQLRDSQLKFAGVLATALCTIYLLVFFFVRRADRIVKTNIDLAIARDSAKKANQTKSIFLANMSHELRTPLNAIIGYSEIIQENCQHKKDKESLEDASRIHSAARHLLHLINEVLDISKIEAGQESIYLEYVKINDVIKYAAELIRPMLEKNNNKLKIEYDDRLDLVKTDLVKLNQIIFNLLSNATKFTSNGEINLVITKTSHWFEVDISDTGIGIEADKLSSLFKPFGQVDSSLTRKYGGTGLGLAITRHFCEMLGGTISVTSQYKLGTTFHVKLPIAGNAPEGSVPG